ncbi:MAG: hypothetical protein OIN89_00035 [Candidatus Methanoperedens sp.]|jgi:KaiC/GvpD/RAD55 family RecA-like ATPase|nr:hypothetical protein [Candidatus Methanoperedens sp.]PKL54748.1 MAG: hypothetical protein CVV36_00035 [Candidatus Methanoperedenaceae archaeon HGW-Methanoperedenaceae-1]
MDESKLSTGISGLDEMLYGGINRGNVVGLVGPPGSGKTLMSLQFLYKSLTDGNNCLYISGSHSERELVLQSKRYGWDIEPYIENKQLALMCLKPVQFVLRGEEFHLVSNYTDELPRIVNEIKKEVVIIDPITDFIMLCKNEIESRSRLLGLFSMIKDNNSTAFITAEAEAASGITKNAIVEYATDGLLVLRRVQSQDLSEITHVIQIAKMRWIKHMREIRQFDFTDNGIEVYSRYDVLLSG